MGKKAQPNANAEHAEEDASARSFIERSRSDELLPTLIFAGESLMTS